MVHGFEFYNLKKEVVTKPWTVSAPPAPAKGKSLAKRRACVAAANSVLESTGDEGKAIQACIGAMRNA